MNPHEIQVSPQPVLNYIGPKDHKEYVDYFILDKTWYAINGFIKWFGVNPWEREVDENGKSRLQMIKPMQFWIRYVIVLLIINALEISLGIYICIYYEAWDAIIKIDSYIICPLFQLQRQQLPLLLLRVSVNVPNLVGC